MGWTWQPYLGKGQASYQPTDTREETSVVNLNPTPPLGWQKVAQRCSVCLASLLSILSAPDAEFRLRAIEGSKGSDRGAEKL